MTNQTIYYLKSIERQLRQIAEEQTGVSLGGEVLWDNLNWLTGHIDFLEKTKQDNPTDPKALEKYNAYLASQKDRQDTEKILPTDSE
jgi:hypothetical protein